MHSRFLFIVGCPRSGTTVLASVLSLHPDIAIGIERYGGLMSRGLLRPSDFERQRFFRVRPGDTWYQSIDEFEWPDHYERIHSKFDNAKYRGDKIPEAYRYYDDIASHFRDVRFIFIVRNIFDVAFSFEGRRDQGINWPVDFGVEKAVALWNEAIACTLYRRDQLPVLIVSYEDFFVRASSASTIAKFLEIEAEPLEGALRQARKPRTRDTGPNVRLTSEQAEFICRNAAFGAYQTLLLT